MDENYTGNVTVLNFGHSDTVQPFMSALGLYYDGRDLLVSVWCLVSNVWCLESSLWCLVFGV